jgi:parallel beta helix pectate lyase-like protein
MTIHPGAVFGGSIIHGDGTTDDTAGVQAALNASDVIVASATYAIAGNISIPTGRHIFCNSGATFLDTQAKSTRMFQIGYSSSSLGNNSIVGCHLQGTNFVPGQPGSYANYKGGTNGYSELLEITSGWGLHTDNVLIQNSAFSNAQGDSILTYSPCGTANTGAACNHGSPGTEGPSNIFIVNNTFSHCGQPAVHLNGGQNLVVTGNTFTDCPADDEADANVLQVMTSWWFGNTFTTQYGTLNALNGQITGPDHSCTGNDLIPQNDEGCWSFNNTFDGVSNAGPTVLREPSGCAGGGGHYLNEHFINGAQLRTGC